MSKIYTILIIVMLSGQPCLLFAEGTYSGFKETTYDDSDWVLAISDTLLREDLCSWPWYEKVFNPCFLTGDTPEYNRYWRVEPGAKTAEAFPMSEFGTVGTGSLDSLYVAEGVQFQLYDLNEDPYGPQNKVKNAMRSVTGHFRWH